MNNSSEAARTLGKIKSVKKSMSSKINGLNRPHLLKLRKFENKFPYPIINNEWKYKFPMLLNGKKKTYNPDYECPKLKCYIEVATSKPNISEQGPTWRAAMHQGLKLRIYWWEGEEITDSFKKLKERKTTK